MKEKISTDKKIKNINKRKILWISVLIFFMIISVGVYFLPETVIIHFDAEGTADATGPRAILLLFVLVPAILGLFTELMLRVIKKQYAQNGGNQEQPEYEKNVNLITTLSLIVILTMEIFLLVLFAVTSVQSFRMALTPNKIDPFGIELMVLSVMLIIFGIFMPKAKRGGAFGVRCSWSNYNQVTWKKSNYYGGIVSIITGVVFLLLSVILHGWINIVLIFPLLICLTVPSLVIAHRIYIKEHGIEI